MVVTVSDSDNGLVKVDLTGLEIYLPKCMINVFNNLINDLDVPQI